MRLARATAIFVLCLVLVHDVLARRCGCSRNRALYYTRAIAFGESCEHGKICKGQNTVCFMDMCKCIPGYHRIPGTDNCVEECTNYGDTFCPYPTYDVVCTGSSAFGMTLQRCLEVCANSTTCLSMTMHPNGYCHFQSCDPLTASADVTRTSTSIVTFVRNCA